VELYWSSMYSLPSEKLLSPAAEHADPTLAADADTPKARRTEFLSGCIEMATQPTATMTSRSSCTRELYADRLPVEQWAARRLPEYSKLRWRREVGMRRWRRIVGRRRGDVLVSLGDVLVSLRAAQAWLWQHARRRSAAGTPR
jgi:hypothetical protein